MNSKILVTASLYSCGRCGDLLNVMDAIKPLFGKNKNTEHVI